MGMWLRPSFSSSAQAALSWPRPPSMRIRSGRGGFFDFWIGGLGDWGVVESGLGSTVESMVAWESSLAARATLSASELVGAFVYGARRARTSAAAASVLGEREGLRRAAAETSSTKVW